MPDDISLSDVYDGREYCQHKDFLSKPENVSFLLNTDGVSMFRSSTVSLWPLWLVINELPPSVRFACTLPFCPLSPKFTPNKPCVCTYRFSKDNMILAGLWFAREKPTMTTYMYPLMSELEQLAHRGTRIYQCTLTLHYGYLSPC